MLHHPLKSKHFRHFIGGIIVLYSIIWTSTLGADYFVAMTGSDSLGNGSPGSPWRTIAYAISAVHTSPSDPITIHVAPGIYRLSTTGENYPLHLKSYLTLLGDADTTSILDAAGSLQRVIECDSVTHVVIEQLTIKNGRAPAVGNVNTGAGIFIRYSSYVTVRNNIISRNRGTNASGGAALGGGIAIIASPYVLITKNEIKENSVIADGAGGGGVYYNSDYGIFSWNTVNDNSAAALFGASGGGMDVTGDHTILINNNVVRNSGPAVGGGITVNKSPLIVRNTIEYNSSGDTVSWEGVYGGGVVCGVGSPILGGSLGNGNNIDANTIVTSSPEATAGRQLKQYAWPVPVNATFNFFGSGVVGSDPREIAGNFQLDPLMPSRVDFDTLKVIAIPSPIEFDTVTVDSPKSVAVTLFNLINSLTDTVRLFSVESNQHQTTIKLLGSDIPPMESETLLVTLRPTRAGQYEDTLSVNTSVGQLIIRVHATVQRAPLGIDRSTAPPPSLSFQLFQNNPNPFNPLTVIRYQLLVSGHATVKVYDLMGREVATLVNESKPPGDYEATWDASRVASGVYYYRLQAGRFVETKKMVLLR